MYTNFQFRLLLILCALSYSAKAQQSLPDSLNKIAVTVSNDSAAKLYVQLARHFLSVSPDSVVVYANKALKIAPANSVAVGDANIQLGNYSHMSGNMDSALYYYTKAQTHFKKINNEKGIGKVYQSFAVVKQSMKDYQGALDDNLKAISIYEKIGFRKGLTMAYTGAGNNCRYLGKNEEGAAFMRKAMSNALNLGDSTFYYQSMAEYAGFKNKIDQADSAIFYFKKSIPYLEQNNFKYNLISAYTVYAAILIKQKPMNDTLVRKYSFGALAMANELEIEDNLQYIYSQIALYYVYKNKPDSVYYYQELSKNMVDSICATQNMEILHEAQTRYETEKKDLQIKNQSLELSTQERENLAKNRLLLIGTLGLIVVGTFAAVAYRNFRKSKRANAIINEQKSRVEEQKREIEEQKLLMEIKQKEITESITYAKDIQAAFMPNEDIFHIIHPDAFIYSKPKDIVSGDFYWFYTVAKDNKPGALRHCAVADCTGHGVPGALMSVICSNALNEAVVHKHIHQSDKILNEARRIVKRSLKTRKNQERKDGMDIALISINYETLELWYSGAYNSAWVCRKAAMIELTADKQPVGVFEHETDFTQQYIQLEKGDVIYLFSDGYADQFGGAHEKKLKYKPFRDLLISVSHLPMNEQKEKLANFFEAWKGTHEQTDDVCVLGIGV